MAAGSPEETWLDAARAAREGTAPAVFAAPPRGNGWLDEIDAMVVSGQLNVPRTVLPAATVVEILTWVELACAVLPARTREPLLADLHELCQVVSQAGDVPRLMLRVFTEAPTRRCGFHVDTVGPQSPTVGALRVYNGAGTEYVEPADVTSMTAFYRHLSRRERLSRDAGSDPAARAALAAMDDAPDFLRLGARVHQVPAGMPVFFRHLDITRHWSAHPVTDAWLHRSPMSGSRRLVVNLSPALAATRTRRLGRAGDG